ncbi:MAG: hypothetical protein HYZ23_10325 [Chloroflexi bacterium]|nr:hypothetical protein [Chloroflexota bacterium]
MKNVSKILWFSLVILGSMLAYVYAQASESTEKYISEQEAIEKAKLYCEQTHSPSQKEPDNFNTKLIQCGQVLEATGWTACSEAEKSPDMMVWYVSMQGLWLHWGPVPADGPHTPISFTSCTVLMEAGSGQMLVLGSN